METSGAINNLDLYRATLGPPSCLLPSPHPCTECLLWVRFCTWFGMGRERVGREGCPQPFPWLLCIWVIIFITIPNQTCFQAGGSGSLGPEDKAPGALGGEGGGGGKDRTGAGWLIGVRGQSGGAGSHQPSVLHAEQLPGLLWDGEVVSRAGGGQRQGLPAPPVPLPWKRNEWGSRGG